MAKTGFTTEDKNLWHFRTTRILLKSFTEAADAPRLKMICVISFIMNLWTFNSFAVTYIRLFIRNCLPKDLKASRESFVGDWWALFMVYFSFVLNVVIRLPMLSLDLYILIYHIWKYDAWESLPHLKRWNSFPRTGPQIVQPVRFH